MKLCLILEKITFYGIFGHQVHKLSVVWTFLDRASIVLDPTGREAEEEVMHVENTNAASVPKIVFRKGERANQVFQGLTTSASQIEGVKKKRDLSELPICGMGTLPYVQGATERLQQRMKKQWIDTLVKQH